MNRAYSTIDNILNNKLAEKNFVLVPDAKDGDSDILLYKGETFAYSVMYERSKQVLTLRSAQLFEDNSLDTWKLMSSWFYDMDKSEQSEAESIAKDFLDIIIGPDNSNQLKQITKTKKKKSKDDERVVDPTFFFNRLSNFFPEIKDEMNKDKIVYGKVRFASLTKSFVAPKCDEFAKRNPPELEKLVALFNDMHDNGDKDLRGIIVHGIFNFISEESMKNIGEYFSEDLAKLYKCSKGLRGKNVKPEKVKKQNKFVAQALENARQTQAQQSKK